MTNFASTQADIRFALSIGAKKEDVAVERVEGREALSELFVYELSVATTPERAKAFAKDLGSDVFLEVSLDTAVVRRLRGILVEVRAEGGALVDQRRRTTLVVMPKLAELQRVKTSRTFKLSDDPAGANTVKEIVLQLLKEAAVEADWQVNRTLDKYVLRMQFEESNFEFMRRMLAFEGIHFHFAHAADKTTVVFTNAPLEDKARPVLTFREGSGGVTSNDVRNLRHDERIRIDALRLTDFDFAKPDLKMSATAPEQPAGRRVYDEHPGEYALPTTVGKGRARRRLEELNDDAERLIGESNSARLSAGQRFAISGHQDPAFDGELVATHVVFTASARGAGTASASGPVSVEFRAVRDTVPLRPVNRPWPLPPIQTARVVGPRKDEPHTASPGSVKVRFYWDVFDGDTRVSEEARCAFVRVGTDMAGPGFGSVMWPRVGMEVVVDFLNGKLDEPVVVRALYNDVNKPPYELPDQETRSGFKSSTVGGEGHNEWFFEDKAGKELVFLHAQRDRKTNVGVNDNETVGANQSVSVGANQSLSAGANQSLSAGAAQTVHAHGFQTVSTDNSQRVAIKVDQTVTVGGARTVTTTGTDSLTAKSVLVKALAEGVEIDGTPKVNLHAGESNYVIISKAGEVAVNAANQIGLGVAGNQLFIRQGTIVATAGIEISLEVGGTSVKVNTDGTVHIKAASKVDITGGGSTVALDSAGVTVKGPMIKLNS